MSDFDFEELDKAVAGVLTPDDVVPEAPVRPVQDDRSTDSAQTQSSPLTSSANSTPEDTPSVEERVGNTPVQAPATRRSSGRFMDVVHPSSDMRTRTGYAPANETTAAEKPTTFVAPVAEDADDDWSKPLESPFLPDAKVEKRPLGGVGLGAGFNPEELLEAPEEELKLEEPDDPRLEATTFPDPIDFAAQNTDAVSEITDELITTTEEADDYAVSIVEEPNKPEAIVFTEPEAPNEPAQEGIPEAAQPQEPTGPTSISQQYQERPSTEQVSGAIYDTESYHQAVVAAPKKRSGAWAILWIILLIILGAGAGVGFYMFVLPML